MRSGDEHRYTLVWVVVVDGRVFVRSWYDAPAGWFRAFLDEARGSIRFGKRELVVRGRPVRSERLRKAVTEGYRKKYPGKGAQKWVVGFAEEHRELTTLELAPA